MTISGYGIYSSACRVRQRHICSRCISVTDEDFSGTYLPPILCTIAGVQNRIPYFMSDSIYSNWPCFLHSVLKPSTLIQKLIEKFQEAFRKEVERAFGLLQAKFHIVANRCLTPRASARRFITFFRKGASLSEKSNELSSVVRML